ncbi:hypothetical protein AUP68_08813 [Ilyonectria robusta]
MGRIQVFKPPVLRPLLSSARPQSPPCTQYHNDMATLEVIANPSNATVEYAIDPLLFTHRSKYCVASFWFTAGSMADSPGRTALQRRLFSGPRPFWLPKSPALA